MPLPLFNVAKWIGAIHHIGLNPLAWAEPSPLIPLPFCCRKHGVGGMGEGEGVEV
jgi:hypothetical protein